jgi:hypothetical protein
MTPAAKQALAKFAAQRTADKADACLCVGCTQANPFGCIYVAKPNDWQAVKGY